MANGRQLGKDIANQLLEIPLCYRLGMFIASSRSKKVCMKRIRRLAISVTSGALLLFVASAWGQITPSEASGYIGKRETVCGQVASANFAARSKGRPTFLNLDRPYPNLIFTVVIWGSDRAKFEDAPERTYSGKKICVTGTISSYRGVPQIVVSDPSQIRRGT
jgi:hypothetical protein